MREDFAEAVYAAATLAENLETLILAASGRSHTQRTIAILTQLQTSTAAAILDLMSPENLQASPNAPAMTDTAIAEQLAAGLRIASDVACLMSKLDSIIDDAQSHNPWSRQGAQDHVFPILSSLRSSFIDAIEAFLIPLAQLREGEK